MGALGTRSTVKRSQVLEMVALSLMMHVVPNNVFASLTMLLEGSADGLTVENLLMAFCSYLLICQAVNFSIGQLYYHLRGYCVPCFGSPRLFIIRFQEGVLLWRSRPQQEQGWLLSLIHI